MGSQKAAATLLIAAIIAGAGYDISLYTAPEETPELPNLPTNNGGGVIYVYPTNESTPIPTPKPTEKPTTMVTNLGILPDYWQTTQTGCSVVTKDGYNAIKISAPAGECDFGSGIGGWHIAVSPGDVIFFSILMKSDASTHGNTKGTIIGFDMYHDYNRVWEVAPGSTTDYTVTDPIFAYAADYTWVPFGSDWTLFSFSWTIPANTFTTDDYGASLEGSYQINYIIPWLTRYWADGSEAADTWFADARIYVNGVLVPMATSRFIGNMMRNR